jgi:hypothetical protein
LYKSESPLHKDYLCQVLIHLVEQFGMSKLKWENMTDVKITKRSWNVKIRECVIIKTYVNVR